MAALPAVEREHCTELAMQAGSLFEFTSRYLPAKQLEPLLAIYAFRQAILSIPHTAVDDEVRWAKLKWWSEELAADPAAAGRHPVLRAMWLSGVRSRVDDALLQALIRDALMQLDIAPDGDEAAMFERLTASNGAEFQLELALDSARIETRALDFLTAASSLFAALAGFAPGHRLEAGPVPLNILAKYNVSSAQLQQKPPPPELPQIIAQLSTTALEWFAEGESGLEISSATSSRACSHLQLRWALEKRQLTRIRKNPARFLETGPGFGPADAWFAWRFLRRLS